MISARVSLETGWGQAMARRIESRVPALMREAAEDGAQVASDASRSRSRTGRMATMDVLPVARVPRGYTGGFRSRAWYARIQSSGSRKIRGLGFLEKGAAAMRRSLVARLNRL